MKHLQELGVDTSKASMMYHFWVGKKYKYKNCFLLSADIATPYDSENVPTFTLQDMLEMIPYLLFGTYFLNINKSSHEWWFIKYTDYLAHDDYEFFHGSNLLEVAYQCLCWLAENNYIGGNNGNDKPSRL